MANYIDEAIMVSVGVWMTAVGFGYLRITNKADNQENRHQRIVHHFKWMGPLLMLIAVFLAIAGA